MGMDSIQTIERFLRRLPMLYAPSPIGLGQLQGMVDFLGLQVGQIFKDPNGTGIFF